MEARARDMARRVPYRIQRMNHLRSVEWKTGRTVAHRGFVRERLVFPRKAHRPHPYRALFRRPAEAVRIAPTTR